MELAEGRPAGSPSWCGHSRTLSSRGCVFGCPDIPHHGLSPKSPDAQDKDPPDHHCSGHLGPQEASSTQPAAQTPPPGQPGPRGASLSPGLQRRPLSPGCPGLRAF